jgi:hypothetical protein
MANTIDQKTIDRALNAPMGEGELTVRRYLCLAVTNLWRDGENFSGKRPVDNSDWQWRIYGALVKAEVIEGSFDEDGYLDQVDTAHGDKVMHAAIDSVFKWNETVASVPVTRIGTTIRITEIYHYDGYVDAQLASGETGSVQIDDLPGPVWVTLGTSIGATREFAVTIPKDGPWSGDIEWLEVE